MQVQVSKRPRRAATEQQLSDGVPLFLDQLTRTLKAEEANEAGESIRISAGSGGTHGACASASRRAHWPIDDLVRSRPPGQALQKPSFASDTEDALASGCDGAALALIERSLTVA